MAPKVIPIAGPKDRASLEVTVVDVKTKAVVDSVKVEVYAQRAPTATKKGKVLFTNLALTSGSTEKGDFFDGWVLKLWKPDGNILRFPPEPQDKLEKPKGGNLHKMTVEVESPTAPVTVTVTEGGKALAGVEVEAHTKDKTGADGKVVVQSQPGKARSVRVRLKGKVLRKKGASKGEDDDLELKLDVDPSSGASVEVEVEALKLEGIVGLVPGTKAIRDPKAKRGPSKLRSAPGEPDHDGTTKDSNRPFVLIRGAGPITLEAESNADKPKASWTFERRDASAGPKPSTVEVDGGRQLTITVDVEGAFVATASLDGGKTTLFWKLDVVSVTVDTSSTRRKTGDAGLEPTGVFHLDTDRMPLHKDHSTTKDKGQTAVQAGRFLLNGSTPQLSSSTPPSAPATLSAAVYLAVKVTISGPPGAEGRVMINLLQNATLSDAEGVYEDGKGTAGELVKDGKGIDSAKGLPVLDANGKDDSNTTFPGVSTSTYPWKPATWPGPWADAAKTIPPFIWVRSSFAVSGPGTAERWVQTIDSPEVVFANKHAHLPNGALDSPFLTSIRGTNRFRSAIASFSLDAPDKILVHADMLWNVDFSGTVKMPSGLLTKDTARPEFTPTTAACKADFLQFQLVSGQPGVGVDAFDAKMDTFSPRFSEAGDPKWTP